MSHLPSTPHIDSTTDETVPPRAEARIVFSRDEQIIADIADKVGVTYTIMSHADLAVTK